MLRFTFVILAIAGVSAMVKTEPCAPGDVKRVDCNDCFCAADGSGYICSSMDCTDGPLYEETIVKQLQSHIIARNKRQAPESTCEPGATFQQFCNTCECPANGLVSSAICTEMACIEGIFNEDGSRKQPTRASTPRNERQDNTETCEFGTTFKYYCNTCRCGHDGRRMSAVCTNAHCPEGVYNEDGSLKGQRIGCDMDTFKCY